MTNINKKLMIGLAAGALAVAMPLSASAQSLGIGSTDSGGVGASVGGNGSGGLGASVGLGGAGSVDASVGGTGTGGLGADAGANVGGTGGVDAGATASIGGSDGTSADVDASVGGTGGTGNTNLGASLRTSGPTDLDANVDANVGDLNADADVNIGDDTGIAAALGFTSDDDAAEPGTPGIDPGITSSVSNMSAEELAAYKKKCIDVLRSPASFESDLVDLCKLVREAAAR
ncbi:MAG: hypothetical protein CML29_02110 [Rhizobiales bacterium]|nr:hypothetical protein [Hyphomicrobiales bacterium]MBA70069.1 hypothetical protein [Hyphomicrobiales bacterium]|tara:strand:- start:248 stop:940 length:693 start_codon:yes stop_codon:yes gene_type:complete